MCHHHHRLHSQCPSALCCPSQSAQPERATAPAPAPPAHIVGRRSVPHQCAHCWYSSAHRAHTRFQKALAWQLCFVARLCEVYTIHVYETSLAASTDFAPPPRARHTLCVSTARVVVVVGAGGGWYCVDVNGGWALGCVSVRLSASDNGGDSGVDGGGGGPRHGLRGRPAPAHKSCWCCARPPVYSTSPQPSSPATRRRWARKGEARRQHTNNDPACTLCAASAMGTCFGYIMPGVAAEAPPHTHAHTTGVISRIGRRRRRRRRCIMSYMYITAQSPTRRPRRIV